VNVKEFLKQIAKYLSLRYLLDKRFFWTDKLLSAGHTPFDKLRELAIPYLAKITLC